MSTFKELVLDPVEKAREGKQIGVPLPLKTVGKIINNIQQRMYILLGGMSGTGKTSFVDYIFVLYAYIWYRKNKEKLKLKIIYYSMERSKKYKIQKWTCMLLYIKYQILIDVPTLNGWEGKMYDINDELFEKIKSCEKFIDELLTSGVIQIIDGHQNPTGISKDIETYMKKWGKEERLSKTNEDGFEYTEVNYEPNDPSLHVLVVLDHIGKLRRERESRNSTRLLNKKENIDRMSEILGHARDRYGITPIVISQFNRSIGNVERMKVKDLAPEPDDFKDSGNIYEDADIAIALYNPYKLKDFNHLGYDVKAFVNRHGYNRFRSLVVLKNSYGVDDVIKGLLFKGECGIFEELPKPDDEYQLLKLIDKIKNE